MVLPGHFIGHGPQLSVVPQRLGRQTDTCSTGRNVLLRKLHERNCYYEGRACVLKHTGGYLELVISQWRLEAAGA